MTVIGTDRGSLRRELDDGRTVVIEWGALSDTGHRRERNEDSLIATPALFAVADGMGGHEAGDRASSAIVTGLSHLSEDFTGRQLYDALVSASREVEEISAQAHGQSGSTITGVAFSAEHDDVGWLVFNIGDSRVYAYYDLALRQITRDHSVVQDLIDSGQLAPEDAEIHPARNSITRAVGFNMDPRPDLWHIGLAWPLRLLVCSDGLTKELHDSEIEQVLSEHPGAFEAARELVTRALEHGGRDNVSVIVVDTEVETAENSAEESH